MKIFRNIKKNKGPVQPRFDKSGAGFVILFAVTLAAILLAIALGVSNIAFREIRFGANARGGNEAFFAADTGTECALYHDPATGSSFSNLGSSSIICLGDSIDVVKTPSMLFWRFTMSGLGSDRKSCAIVTVDKTSPPATTLISKGYNKGNASCFSSDYNRIERELKVTY